MQDLRERLSERALLKGVELGKDEERVLRDLRRWLRRDIPCKGTVRTEDGSYTLIDPEHGEPYHSLTAGALTESLEKFFKPSGLSEIAPFRERIAILDVGFGLGYNTAVAVYELRKLNRKVRVEVIALDKNVPENIPDLPEPYTAVHRKIMGLLPEGESDGVSVKLYEGDMRKTLKAVRNFRADVVFHDPFSPYRNPEAWSLELLGLVKKLLREDGVWVSYTSSLPVRRALYELGFKLGSTPSVGRKRGGTVASIKGCVGELTAKERLKLLNSPYSVPLRDPGLYLHPTDILIDYRLSVLLRERAVSSERRRELSQIRSS